MSQTSDNSPLITPTLQHFGVLSLHLERTVDWYAKVVGMKTRYSISRGSAGASVTFLSNDMAHHRLAIISRFLKSNYQAEILTPMLLNLANRNKIKNPGIRIV